MKIPVRTRLDLCNRRVDLASAREPARPDSAGLSSDVCRAESGGCRNEQDGQVNGRPAPIVCAGFSIAAGGSRKHRRSCPPWTRDVPPELGGRSLRPAFGLRRARAEGRRSLVPDSQAPSAVLTRVDPSSRGIRIWANMALQPTAVVIASLIV